MKEPWRSLLAQIPEQVQSSLGFVCYVPCCVGFSFLSRQRSQSLKVLEESLKEKQVDKMAVERYAASKESAAKVLYEVIHQ